MSKEQGEIPAPEFQHEQEIDSGGPKRTSTVEGIWDDTIIIDRFVGQKLIVQCISRRKLVEVTNRLCALRDKRKRKAKNIE